MADLINKLIGSPSEEVKKKILAIYKQNPDDFGPVLSGDPGSAPTHIAGMVMNPKNAKLISKFLQGEGSQKVINYLALKYPKMSSLPSKITNVSGMPGGMTGWYEPVTKEVAIRGGRSIPDMVTTGAHELTHAYRDRNGLMNTLLHPSEYISDSGIGLQLEEIYARKGGETARKTYEKFLELSK